MKQIFTSPPCPAVHSAQVCPINISADKKEDK